MVCLPKHCKKNPRYSDGVIVHLYCSRTCANLARGRALTSGNTPVPTSPVKARNPSIVVNPSNASTPGNATNRLGTAPSTNTRSGLVPTKRGVIVPTSPRNSVISMNPRDSTASMNPRYSFVSMNPRDSIVSMNPRDSVISMNSSITLRNRSSVYPKGSSVPICKTPGCSSPVYVDRHGIAGEYCTRTHQQYVFQLYLVS